MNVIGNEVKDIDKLGVRNKTMVVIPGYISKHYPDVAFMDAVNARSNPEMEEAVVNYMNSVTDYCVEYGSKKGYKLECLPNLVGDITVTKIGMSFALLVRNSLEVLVEDEDEDTVVFESMSGKYTEGTAIYNTARILDLKISVKAHNGKWIVTRRGSNQKQHPKSTTRGLDLSSTVRTWLNSIPFDEPTQPPEAITQACSDSYLRTVLNKAPYCVTYRKKHVTKHTWLLRKRHNKWALHHHNKTILTMDTFDTAMLKLSIIPYNITIDDITIIGEK